jgi:hypothetical protein
MIGRRRSGSSLAPFVVLAALLASVVTVVPGGPRTAGAAIACGETSTATHTPGHLRDDRDDILG